MIEDYWGPSQKLLGDMRFLESLKQYDKDNIPPDIMKKIREKWVYMFPVCSSWDVSSEWPAYLGCRYMTNAQFTPDVVKSASTACEGLCRWVRAMEVYDRVAKVVAPKKAALAQAEAELSVQMAKLNTKRAELKEVITEV